MRLYPKCLFLDSPYPFDKVYKPPLFERLDSLVEIILPTSGFELASIEDVSVCVSWDDSPPVLEVPSGVELIVHCGLFPKTVFPSMEMPDSWVNVPVHTTRPGPRSWSNAGLRRGTGAHWTGSWGQKETLADGPRMVVVSEPIERGISEKLLGLAIMVTCGQNSDSSIDAFQYQLNKDFYDITLGVVGLGGAAPAFCRLLRNFEIGLMLHDPDINFQATAELGAKYCKYDTTVAREADLLVLFPNKNPIHPIFGTELWQARPVGLPTIAVDEYLVAEGALKDFKGCAYVGSRNVLDSHLVGESAVNLIYGLNQLLANSLSRVGAEVVDVVHKYVASKGNI